MIVGGRKKKKHNFLKLLTIGVIILFFALYDSNTRIEITEYTVSGDIPQGFDGFKIVQLSDLHKWNFGKENKDLFAAVAQAEPDIIAVTGDIISHTGDEDYVLSAREYVSDVMENLTDIAPVYYVTGNHEWASGWINELFEILEDCGVTVLRNSYVTLTEGEDKLIIAGVDDPNGPADMKTPEEVVSEIRGSEGDGYIVMLSHRNTGEAVWSFLENGLVLQGHAHGGIIRLPFGDGLVSPGMTFFPDYTSGLRTQDGVSTLISRGLGNTPGTLRLFNNPEIVVAVLEKE